MKTARRHELQHNQLADWLGEKIEEVTPYSRTIAAGVIAILALVAVMVIWNRRNTAQEEDAWNSYFHAFSASRETSSSQRRTQEDLIEDLTRTADKYPDRAAGHRARLTLANTQLNTGIENLFRDREASKEELDDALKNFEKVFSASSDASLREEATLGMARTYEAQGKLDDARKKYETMIKTWPNGIYTFEAKARSEDLSQKPTEEFYAWFEKVERKPPSSSPFGDPKLPFNHPPISSPSFGPLEGTSISSPSETPATDAKKPAEEKKPDEKPADEGKNDEKKLDEKKADEKAPAKEPSDEKAKEPEQN